MSTNAIQSDTSLSRYSNKELTATILLVENNPCLQDMLKWALIDYKVITLSDKGYTCNWVESNEVDQADMVLFDLNTAEYTSTYATLFHQRWQKRKPVIMMNTPSFPPDCRCCSTLFKPFSLQDLYTLLNQILLRVYVTLR